MVADHGEMLGEHGELTHGFFIYEAATRIPLIVSGPGVPAGVVADQVRIVDVMPTALSLLGIPVPTEVQGTNLMPLARGQHLDLVAHTESWYPRYHYGWSELRSIQDGRFKLIRAPRPELYDLATDPERGTRPIDGVRVAARRVRAARSTSSSRDTARAGAREGPADPSMRKRKNAWPRWGMSSGSVNLKTIDEPASRRSQGQDRALQPA